ncbi:MAG TPA: ethanolamine ammonia-lyase subunit EutC [Terriglobales bacterium]|nr:ethanolamine ammonia-lyase subunit EutC [Terriglobales bacterium]
MSDSLPEIVRKVRLRTPARLLAGRTGGAYRTATQLELRAAHAAARDAVRTDFNIHKHLGSELVERFGIFAVISQATSKDEYLLRPDLGRRFADASRADIQARCAAGADLQIIIGDGLSTAAVTSQVPGLVPQLISGAEDRNWKIGQLFAIRFCRVGILNDLGDLLRPRVAVLLIGERPGLATAESLSAYMAFQPRSGQTDADRNLISNIHARGVPPAEAAVRILNLAEKLMLLRTSGVAVREELPGRVSGHLRE